MTAQFAVLVSFLPMSFSHPHSPNDKTYTLRPLPLHTYSRAVSPFPRNSVKTYIPRKTPAPFTKSLYLLPMHSAPGPCTHAVSTTSVAGELRRYQRASPSSRASKPLISGPLQSATPSPATVPYISMHECACVCLRARACLCTFGCVHARAHAQTRVGATL